MTWMQTYSGKAFVIANPTPDQITLEDIGHALSNQCRFAGHSIRFYSVAEHCVHVCNRVQELLEVGDMTGTDRQYLGAALLHDAAEAYLLDMPRPLKIEPEMEFYRGLHTTTRYLIMKKFGLPVKKLSLIRQADHEMLATEARQIMVPPPMEWDPLPDSLEIVLNCWTPSKAYAVFMKQAAALGLSDA